MRLLLNLLISVAGILIAAYLIPGVSVEGWTSALVLAIVLGVLNTFIKPILVLLTLPFNILTLGLFTLIINVALIMLASYIVPGFAVTGFLSALLFGVVTSLVGSFLALAAQ